MEKPNTEDLAKIGDIEGLKERWSTRKNDDIWHPETTSVAASYDKLECLRFAIEHGCPWHAFTTY